MKAPALATFGSMLAGEEIEHEPAVADSLHKLRRRLLLPLAIGIALIALWATLAPLSGAIVAPAQIKVELNRKTVQHQEGGIVRQILVRNGQTVRAGEPLMVIGDLRGQAELNLLQDQLRAERMRNARANAEATLAEKFVIPESARTETQSGDYADRESARFLARRRTLDEQTTALEGQAREAISQASALQAQINAGEVSAKLAADELEINQKLVSSGYVQRARILQLQRAESDALGKVAESRSDLAQARQRAAEVKASIVQARNVYQQQATDELKDSSTKLRELQERLEPSLDQVERQIVRSPVAGEVMAMKVSGVGAVIAPREPLLDVVPSQERLVVEAMIRPQDINHVHRDSDAQVRLTSFDARTTPLLNGKVTFVSGDRVTSAEDRSGFFTATVEVDAATLKSHPDIHLQPGMPAELYVATGKRTLIEYLLRPLTVFSHRAMREP
jgi:HlyD family type I secretion membrane fusion protein